MELKMFLQSLSSRVILISLLTYLSSCSITSDPFFKDKTTYPEREKFKDEDKQLKLSFLARELMESDNRAILLKEIQKTKTYQQWNAAQSATLIQATTDLVVGNLSSALGANLGGAFFVGAVIWGEFNDGSMDTIGQAFFPAIMDDKKLETQDQAQIAMIEFAKNRMKTISIDLGWSYACIHSCNTTNPIMTLRIIPNSLNDQFIYRPEVIVATLHMNPPVEVSPTDPVSAMTGIPIKWKTQQGRTYFISLWSEPFYNEKGNVIVKISEEHLYPTLL